MLASTADGRILTGADWKCTGSATPPSDWMEVDFDDSEWPNALGCETNPGPVHSAVSGIFGCAYWIWATCPPGLVPYGWDDQAYCRYTILS